MRLASRAQNAHWTACWIVAICLVFSLASGFAQKKPTLAPPQDARKVLIEKAHALEARGRPDMAIQLWQQVLLSDPRNTEALVGLAKDLKLIGSNAQADQALDRLRKLDPSNPNIAKIGGITSTRVQSDRLRQAGELARQGRATEAMNIYRELFGDHPPDGDIALAYYQTLYSTPLGKADAIAAMRALAQRNPGDTRFAVELGRMLTYDAKTRAEGIRILRGFPHDALAQSGLRQALIWDSSNPSSAEELRQYLKDHPQDAEISGHLKENESKLAQMNSGIARTPAERAAFAALNAHRLDEAQNRFMAILQQEPQNGRVAAGLGFLRMQQSNFGGAIGYLTQAEENGYKARAVEDALATSRFWYTMGEASQAFDENQLDLAAAKYKASLAMRPRSPEALNGLAGLLTREQQYSDAAGVYEELVKVQPASAAGWRGLFLSYARDGQNQKATMVAARFPAAVRTAMTKDPEYLRTLATLYHAEGRDADAQRALAQALALPLPEGGANLQMDTRLQYAGILMEAKRFQQAEQLYGQILHEDPSNLSAWMGLTSAHHELGHDAEAIADVQKMPPATYEAALGDAGFLSMLGGMYAQANQFEIAQGLLERAAKMQISAGGEPPVPLQLQLASVYLQRNNTAQAYEIYRRVLAEHPDRVDAWKGLIAALQATNRNAEALAQIAAIPPAVRKQLESDIEFVQTEAGLYAAASDTTHAVETMNRVLTYYASLKQPLPAAVEVQNAWLLFNTKNDRALYPALMRLGSRTDLTDAQREVVQTIWANWSVRRAATAMENGNVQRAVDILDAASQAFPDNLDVRKAVAGGYARVGRAKEAMALYKSIPMQDATAADFQGAVGAALGANDRNQAELWLRQALERYPRNPGILQLAARYEQVRGDAQRAADYYRAALAAMPQASPVDKLAHELVYPDQDTKARRAVTAADLQHLLDPSYEPFAKTTKIPPLPAYGADPYTPGAPVVLSQRQAPAQQPNPWANAPLSHPGSPATGAANAMGQAPIAPQMADSPAPQMASAAPPAASPVRSKSKSRNAAKPRSYEGVMNLPADGKVAATRAGAAENPPAAASALQAEPTLAGEAWKGLIASLTSNNRFSEASQELAKIPPAERQQLESDPEFVQAEASLFAGQGDIPHATECLNRVENYYLLRRTAAPPAIALESARLQFEIGDDRDLYPALLRLDSRRDLSAAERQQAQKIWVDWSVRRAQAAMDAGNIRLGVEILDAAARDYPDATSIRRAAAGGYAHIGRADEAVKIYKGISMADATPEEFQAAIAAAISARDLSQAETWLRQALARYPQDAAVLAVAARFEQARGNDQRATDFWRAALAAIPPGSRAAGLASLPLYPQSDGNLTHTPARDLKQLLDPANQPAKPANTPLALPSYRRAPAAQPAPPQMLPANPQQGSPWTGGPSAGSQPAPSPALSNPPLQAAQGLQPALPDRVPVYIPQNEMQPAAPKQPAFIEQSSVQPLVAEGQTARRPDPTAGLRLSAQPMEAQAANAQALFADQTDSQLSQGAAVRPLGNAPVSAPALDQTQPGSVYNMAQYTPSAQEAATGAYSAPRQANSPNESAPQQAPPTPAASAKKSGARPGATASARPKRSTAARRQSTPTLESAPTGSYAAPSVQNGDQLPPVPAPELPAEPQTTPTSGAGLSDQELQERNLPPLRGPWVRVQREARTPSPRDEAEMQLRSIESGYSAWLGGAGTLNYRSGSLGFDHLSALESPFEVSTPLGYTGRFTVVAKPVFLDSGQADGSATTQFTTLGQTGLVTKPEPLGTLLTTDSTPPPQQNAAGIGGEVQLAFSHFAMAAGYTPYGFLVSNATGRVQWRPGNGPFTFNFVRDSVKDSQLSYGGLRNPGSATLSFPGNIWGGVMANQGGVQYGRGDAQSGFYMGANAQYITGYNVQENKRIDGDGGAYWRIFTSPESGALTVGANFFGMHYAHNENAFTWGMGGYFSPQAYFLANVPFNWNGHSGTKWHYTAVGSLGVQAFQESLTPLFPLSAQEANEVASGNLALPAKTSVGPNYDLHGSVAYQIGPHWFAGGYLSGNNSRNYSSVSTGFFVRYVFRSQPSTVAGPTGLFPTDGLRPFTVP